MSRRTSALCAAIVALLAAPATASATTFTVDQTAAAGCNSNRCQTVKDALGAVQNGDTIEITGSATPYTEDPLVLNKSNVTISAVPGTVVVTGKATNAAGSHVLDLQGQNAVVRGIIFAVQDNGGNAVRASATGTTVESSTLAKFTATTTDVPTYEVAPAVGAGTSFLKGSFVIHGPQRAEPGAAAAVQGNETSSLALLDTSVLSGPNGGSAVRLTGSEIASGTPTANQVVRSQLVATKSNGAHALEVVASATHAANSLVKLDSSTLAGGQNGAGLRVETVADGGAPLSNATTGDVRVEGTHVSIASATGSVQALARADGENNALTSANDPAGSIDVALDRSIVHGAATLENNDGGLFVAANTSKVTITNSDTELKSSDASGSTLAVSGTTGTTSDAALFVNAAAKNLHLRANAPVIDKGGALVAGGSDKDIDGQARLNGAALDLGGDEFHNIAPLARLRASTLLAKQNETVHLDAGESADPEAASGGGVKEYRWDFGDGTTATTTAAQTTKAYANPGVYPVSVTVVDSFDVTAVSEVLPIAVTDGVGPTVRITTPKANVTLKRYTYKKRKVKGSKRTRTTRTVRQHSFRGTAGDPSGVTGAQISLRLVTPAASTSQRRTSTCRFLDKTKNSIVGRPCGKPIFFPIRLKDGVFAYKTKKRTKLRNGLYEVTVRVTDTSGNVGSDSRRFRVKTR